MRKKEMEYEVEIEKIISKYKKIQDIDQEEALDGDDVDYLIEHLRNKINYNEGNINLGEMEMEEERLAKKHIVIRKEVSETIYMKSEITHYFYVNDYRVIVRESRLIDNGGFDDVLIHDVEIDEHDLEKLTEGEIDYLEDVLVDLKNIKDGEVFEKIIR